MSDSNITKLVQDIQKPSFSEWSVMENVQSQEFVTQQLNLGQMSQNRAEEHLQKNKRRVFRLDEEKKGQLTKDDSVEAVKQENMSIGNALADKSLELSDRLKARLTNRESQNSSHILLNSKKLLGDSKEMKAVKDSLTNVEFNLDQPVTMENFANQMSETQKAYENAISACRYYVETKTTYTGSGRYILVKNKLKTLLEEYSLIRSYKNSFAANPNAENGFPTDGHDILFLARVKRFEDENNPRENKKEDTSKVKPVELSDEDRKALDDAAETTDDVAVKIINILKNDVREADKAQKAGDENARLFSSVTEMLQKLGKGAQETYLHTAFFALNSKQLKRTYKKNGKTKTCDTVLGLKQTEDGSLSVIIADKEYKLPYKRDVLLGQLENKMIDNEKIYGTSVNAQNKAETENTGEKNGMLIKNDCKRLIGKYMKVKNHIFDNLPVEDVRYITVKVMKNEWTKKDVEGYVNNYELKKAKNINAVQPEEPAGEQKKSRSTEHKNKTTVTETQINTTDTLKMIEEAQKESENVKKCIIFNVKEHKQDKGEEKTQKSKRYRKMEFLSKTDYESIRKNGISLNEKIITVKKNYENVSKPYFAIKEVLDKGERIIKQYEKMLDEERKKLLSEHKYNSIDELNSEIIAAKASMSQFEGQYSEMKREYDKLDDYKKESDLYNEQTKQLELQAEEWANRKDNNVLNNNSENEQKVKKNEWKPEEQNVVNLLSDMVYDSNTWEYDNASTKPGQRMKMVVQRHSNTLFDIILDDNALKNVLKAIPSPDFQESIMEKFQSIRSEALREILNKGDDVSLSEMKAEIDEMRQTFYGNAKLLGYRAGLFLKISSGSMNDQLAKFEEEINKSVVQQGQEIQKKINETMGVEDNSSENDTKKKKSNKPSVPLTSAKQIVEDNPNASSQERLESILNKSLNSDKGQKQFVSNVISSYFTEASVLDKRSMVGNALRNIKPVNSDNESDENNYTDMISGFIKGAGPLFQKMLQGMPTKDADDVTLKILADIKSNLSPIPQKIVEAQMYNIVKRSNGSITKIEVMKSLGAASVGQAFLCKIYGSEEDKKDGKEVVVKLLRSDARNRMLREREIMLKAAEKTSQSMKKTYEGMLDRIEDEFDLTIESDFVEAGQLYNNARKNEVHSGTVEAMKVEKSVVSTSTSMVCEKAPGTTVDRYFKELDDFSMETMDGLLNYELVDGKVISKNQSGDLDFLDPENISVEAVKKLPDIKAKLQMKLQEVLNRQKKLITLAERWVEEGLFKGGFYHGDLHAGNIMISDEQATLIDFGNCTQLTEEQKKQVTIMLSATAVSDVREFEKSFYKLIDNKEDLDKIDESQKTQFRAWIEKIFSIGDARDSGYRILTSLTKAQELDIPLPSAIYNFSQSQIRLNNTIESLNKYAEKLNEYITKVDGYKSDNNATELDLIGALNAEKSEKKTKNDGKTESDKEYIKRVKLLKENAKLVALEKSRSLIKEHLINKSLKSGNENESVLAEYDNLVGLTDEEIKNFGKKYSDKQKADDEAKMIVSGQKELSEYTSEDIDKIKKCNKRSSEVEIMLNDLYGAYWVYASKNLNDNHIENRENIYASETRISNGIYSDYSAESEQKFRTHFLTFTSDSKYGQRISEKLDECINVRNPLCEKYRQTEEQMKEYVTRMDKAESKSKEIKKELESTVKTSELSNENDVKTDTQNLIDAKRAELERLKGEIETCKGYIDNADKVILPYIVRQINECQKKLIAEIQSINIERVDEFKIEKSWKDQDKKNKENSDNNGEGSSPDDFNQVMGNVIKSNLMTSVSRLPFGLMFTVVKENIKNGGM